MSAPEIGNATLAGMLRDGEYLVLREEAGLPESWQTIRAVVIEEAGRIGGAEAESVVRSEGLGLLHEVMPASKIGALRDAVMPRVREELLRATCRVAREVLGLEGEFFVDDYTILRVNYPFEIAIQASREAENPGIGRMSETVKGAARARKVVDPIYDPRGYHRDQPPASWAHGPHLDTWTGHSRDGVNLWWAISDVLEENSMFFYPELFGRPMTADPRSLYLAEGQVLPEPTPFPLRAGSMLVFNPEVLHGTHLNVSGRTRVAASTRINARTPQFDPACFYAREFWHRGSRIEAGEPDVVEQFPREEHLGPALPPASGKPLPPRSPRVVEASLSPEAWTDVCELGDLAGGQKLLVESGDERIMVVQTSRGVRAIGALCPHLGTSLMDGCHDDHSIHCPAHAMRFSLDTGHSSSPILRLLVADVRLDGDRVSLRLRPKVADSPDAFEPSGG